jgi:cyclase
LFAAEVAAQAQYRSMGFSEMTTLPSGLPRSEYFKVVEAGDRIWAAIATDWVNTVGNATIVDLGGRVLVVDTFISARAAVGLREAARRLTGAEAAWVVNTHFHNDHCGGNEVFATAAAIATEKTRDLIVARAEALPERIAAAEAELAGMPVGDPEADRRRMEFEAEVDLLRRLRYVAPTATISDRLTLFGEKRRAEVISVGAAHTPSDAVVHLPDDRVLAAGDVVLNATHAWVGDGDVRSWIGVLPRLRALDPATLIPGHGDVGDASAIDAMDDYMRDLLALAEATVAAGVSAKGSAAPGSAADAATSTPEIPERFRSWGWSEGWAGSVEAAIGQVRTASR